MMDRRLYTPPTCTLLVETPNNWLPSFSQKPDPSEAVSFTKFNFALSFDDPCQTGESITIKGDRSLLDRLHLVVNNYIQKLLAAPPQVAFSANQNLGKSSHLRLQQQDLLTHTLHLGELQEAKTAVTTVDLTTIQLFDLATALDAYTKELDTPAPVNTWWKSKWFSSWGLGSAAIFLFAGLTYLGFQLLQVRNSAESTIETPLPPSNNPAAFGLQIFPTPKASIPPLPQVSPLGATQKLPIPVPVQVPPGGVAASTPLLVPPERATNSSIAIFPEQTNTPFSNPANLANTAISPRIVGRNQGPSPTPAASQNSSIAPVSPLPGLPNLPNLPALSPDTIIEIPPPEAPQLRVNEDVRADIRETRDQTPVGETLFDRLPQVPEVRKYFQARWQPPLGLNQVLEYNIVLNRDGTIAQITPLGQTALANIDRLGIPSPNAPFVSPLISGENPQIRLVLTPEGAVQAFLASPN